MSEQAFRRRKPNKKCSDIIIQVADIGKAKLLKAIEEIEIVTLMFQASFIHETGLSGINS